MTVPNFNLYFDVNSYSNLNNFIYSHNVQSIGRKFDVFLGDGVKLITDFDLLFNSGYVNQYYLITNITFFNSQVGTNTINYYYKNSITSALLFNQSISSMNTFIDTNNLIVSYIAFNNALGNADVVEFNYISILIQ